MSEIYDDPDIATIDVSALWGEPREPIPYYRTKGCIYMHPDENGAYEVTLSDGQTVRMALG